MIWKAKRNRDRKPTVRTDALKRRAVGPERLEARRLFAADPIHVGVVYLETDYLESDQDVGSDSRGDRFILSFSGGAPDTELSEVKIITDKDGDGITVGDLIYDTEQGGRGKNGSHGFSIVRMTSADGREIDATAQVADGGQELVLRLSNFKAGDRLEFTLDVDEVLRNVVDLAIFNDRLDVIASGQEFQDSILEATFNAPHFETAHADAIFENDYGDPESAFGLNLPPDEGTGPDSRPNRSAAAVASARQTAKPIELSGTVWVDNNLDSIRQAGERVLPGVEVALWMKHATGVYVDSGLRATTDASGKYMFPKSLGLKPGTYRVVETQPDGLYSVAAIPGRVAGASIGTAESKDILTGIDILLGDTSAVDYDFAEAEPASISGVVYIDANNNGKRDNGEVGIPGVTMRLVPFDTTTTPSVLTVTTSGNGSYTFTGLPPGSYEVIEVNQPSGLNDGIDTAGTIDGQVVGTADNPGDRIHSITLIGGSDGVEYNFGETPYGSIAGFVYLAGPGQDCDGDHDGNGSTPIPGVRVELQTESGTTVFRTTTGADGGYQFAEIPVGNYRIVEFTPDGLIDGGSHVGRINNITVGTSVDGGLISQIAMTPSGVGLEYNFCEAAPATLSGYVYQDGDDDGNRDAGEEPIAQTQVTLINGAGETVATTTTDAAGRYEFKDLMPGDYSIVETQPAGFLDGKDSVGNIRGTRRGRDAGNDTLASIELKQGDIGVEYNFGELKPASLFGQVFVDTDDDCERDEDELLLAGVTIRLVDASGTEVATTTTNADGAYSFTGLRPGTYTVIESQPDGYFEGNAIPGSAGGTALDGSRIGSITLASGVTAVEYDFCERPPAEIRGSVFSDLDEDCEFDANEVGIEGARVELYDGTGKLVGFTNTDASGNYQFTNLPAGEYSVREIQPAGWLQGGQKAGSHGGDDSQTDVISRIPVGWGERLTRYNFCELEPASIAGIVYVDGNGDCIRDPGEPPLEGVTIELRDASGQFISSTVTNADGAYSFTGLRPGSYQLFEQQPDGYFQGGQVVGTGDGQVLGEDLLGARLHSGEMLVNYDFCELPAASLGGRVWKEAVPNQVFDPGDEPLAGVLVELIDDAGSIVRQVRTDASGDYLFNQLAPGVYSVRETQPAGLFHGGQVVGDVGGSVGGDDWLVGIELRGGVDARHYDFPEVPPALISGHVFQDGEAIRLSGTPDAKDLRQYRDGELTPDDTLLGGVTIELRNLLGLPFLADRALPGVYEDGPIRVTTDENGYYEFTGLRPGVYHVYQVQPENYVDGLDTPGSTGGIAVNPADVVDDDDRIVIQTLSQNEASDPRNDAILNVTLIGGGESINNNFSEIVIAPNQIPQLEPPRPQTPRAEQPIETFDPRIRIVSFAQPLTYRTPVVTDDEWAVSWHLSVINGGFPGGGVVGEDGLIQGVSTRKVSGQWIDGNQDRGRWTIVDRDGKRMAKGDALTLGVEDGWALAGDFDGDGVDEGVLYKNGQWFVDFNGNGKWDAGDLWMQLGTELDRPVVGDWDGDGKDDIGIFGRQWHRDEQKIKKDPGLPDPDNKRRREVDSRSLATIDDDGDDGDDRKRLMVRGDQGSLRADAVDHVFKYGEQADTPIAGDWNGDGIDQIGVFDSGNWLLDADGDGRWTDNDEKVKFGQPGDEPIVGDFNGDQIDEIGVVRGDLWIIDTDGDRRITGNDLQIQVPRDNPDSQPVVGDFDGDGKDDAAYYDESA
ncbi:Serine-aspartate repeat-containing protein D precursor [Rubripirellula tenax]|uniref:Serine-aspartate repeat-containing protein D n=1 Tax=Rubripirellula tenax TaxID=2528015 RepID=A0A5C6FI68_9BACT|nr:SdrD B-like domain-containing protein [Rubripirellula tenax]TWU60273.1 Serine-aspartate repeat-containing protein D precursor [Rubripirellula tenax]